MAPIDVQQLLDRRPFPLTYPQGVPQLLKMSDAEFAGELRFLAAVKFYELGTLSSGKAAELAGMERVEFLSSLASVGVPAINLRGEEIDLEISAAGNWRNDNPSAPLPGRPTWESGATLGGRREPLIFLSKLGRLDLLKAGAETVCVAQAVVTETQAKLDDAARIISAACQSWLSVRQVANRQAVEILLADLGTNRRSAPGKSPPCA